jgi:uncharacterized protein (TIGR02145 family)
MKNMKKLFLLMLLCPAMLPAQSKIAITKFSVKPGTPATVTFNVQWTKTPRDSAWVFVDYNDKGTMKRLELSGATLTPSSSPGKAYMVSGNKQGAWVVASNAGAFSATVQLLTATATAGFPGACGYAIDYPPVGKYTAADKITFTGTPPFYLTFTDVSTPATVSEKTGDSYTGNFAGKTIASFHDATGAPGLIIPATFTLNVSAESYCAGSAGVSFTLTGTHHGVQYQLIEKDAGIVKTLDGTGSAATFSGTYPAGVYSATTLPTAVFREVAMDGAPTVTKYSNPDPPAMTGGGSQCGGTKSIKAEANGDGAIRWTDNSSTVSTRTVGTGTYYAVTTSAASCESAAASVSVTINPVPTISRSGGDASQTVNQNTDISPITYTASNATSIVLSSGSLPASVTGTATGTVFTIKGAPSATGMYNYTVTASNTNGCGPATATGTITVVAKNNCASGIDFKDFPSTCADASVGTKWTLYDGREGSTKTYTVVKMPDSRIWMAQNLNYQSGLTFTASPGQPNTSSGGQNTALYGRFWCSGSDGSTAASNQTNCNTWGALYSWETAMLVDGKWSDDNKNSTGWGTEPTYSTNTSAGNTNNGGRGSSKRGICPTNWHVPTDSEWGVMLDAVESANSGGYPGHNSGTGYRGNIAGKLLKSSGTGPATDSSPLWANETLPGADQYGFGALPAGYRLFTSYFYYRGSIAFFWSSSAYSSSLAWYRYISSSSEEVNRWYEAGRSYGYSVRCIRD